MVRGVMESKSTAWLARRLRQIPGLHARLVHNSRLLEVSANGAGHVTFTLVEASRISEERALQLVAQTTSDSPRRLFITAQLTPTARRYFSEADISWVERVTGRCRLSGPGILVDITPEATGGTQLTGGITPSNKKGPAAMLRDRSGLIAEALLTHWIHSPVRLGALASETQVSRGLASRLLSRLTDLGILLTHGRGPKKHWTLIDPSALLDQWSVEERPQAEEVTGLSLWARSEAALLPKIARLADRGITYALGGVAAANTYAPSLTVLPVPEVWVPAHLSPAEIADALDSKIVASGMNIRLWQTRGDPAFKLARDLPTEATSTSLRVVSRFRAFVEASHSPGRGQDVASQLRRKLNLKPSVLATPNVSNGGN